MLHNKAYSVPPRMHQMRNLTNALDAIFSYQKLSFIYIIKCVSCLSLRTFWLCLWTHFVAKYTYGLLMTWGVSEKYKLAYFQEKTFFEKKNQV